jgi:replicative DNA helicase
MLESHNVEAEMSVIGAILLDNQCMVDVEGEVIPADFSQQNLSHIYGCACALSERAEPIDLVTITAELKKNGTYDSVGGSELLNELIDYVPTASNVAYYVKMVKSCSLYRKGRAAGAETLQAKEGEEVDDYLDRCESSFMLLRDNIKSTDIQTGRSLVNECMANLQKRFESGDVITGARTGLKALDFKLSGLHGGELIIVAGRPSMGKSSLVQNMGEYLMLDKNPKIGSGAGMIFSMEMPSTQWVDRSLCSLGKISGARYKTGQLEPEEWTDLNTANNKIHGMKMFIDDTANLSIMELRAKARRVHRKHNLSFIIIDYIQLMRTATADRNEGIGEITRQLKCLAKELNIPVIALSQLSRAVENRPSKRPIMSDLRDSGSIEQDADVILFVYRETIYCEDCAKGACLKNHGRNADIIVGKHRQGEVGNIEMHFIGENFKFADIERQHGDFNH